MKSQCEKCGSVNGELRLALDVITALVKSVNRVAPPVAGECTTDLPVTPKRRALELTTTANGDTLLINAVIMDLKESGVEVDRGTADSVVSAVCDVLGIWR